MAINEASRPEVAVGRKTSEPDWQQYVGSPEGEDWRLFRPRLDDDGTSYERLRQILKLDNDASLRRLEEVAQGFEAGNQADLRLKVSAALLRDLLKIGWEFHLNSHWIFVRPPKTATLLERKGMIRQQLLYGRNDQLMEDSNRRFIFSLERPSKYSSAKPITDLIADGRRLYDQIAAVRELDPEDQLTALKSICQPYLQLVSEDRDSHSNIRLIDIWRYFRHSWSTRYRSSPGRNLFYLIRDAAQPNHPVMGIAALGNTVMQLTPRDTALGWTVEGLLKLLKSNVVSDSEVIDAFKKRLEEDYTQLFLDDLPIDPCISRSLDDDALSRLAVIEEDSQKEREKLLKSDYNSVAANKTEDMRPERLLELTRTPLYRSKRARAAREVLKSYRIISSWRGTVDELSRVPEGEAAIAAVIKQLKKRYSATSMMEITVCGAVPPYNHLLGGKLVCLMMMSPRVVNDYQGRYKDVVSIIASQMAGRPITKAPTLNFLGTTSLYTDHSSQYNRVKLPAGSVSGQSASIEYQCLGRTEGFGSPNLSAETEKGLAVLASEAKNFRNVNFVFGEGQSPKLRQLREGFSALGLDQSNLLKHGSPRIIYGVSLTRNLERTVLGVDAEPDYVIAPKSQSAEAEIAEYWVERWLASRIKYAPALEALQGSSPLKERVSRLIPDRPEQTSGQRSLFTNNKVLGRGGMNADIKAEERLRFVKLLYRNESAFSDHVSLARLRDLNIKTNLEDTVRRIVRAGGSVVITGNAGDGKTHAILLMKNDLKDAEVITDASEHSSAEIAGRWNQARSDGKPFCIAINEGPLVDLIRSHKTKYPWLEEVQKSLMQRVTYRPLVELEGSTDDTWRPQKGETVVIDLSLRRVLSADLTGSIIKKLTEDSWYAACESCPAKANCAVTYNRAMLRQEVPQDRMVKILVSVGERGAKVTFREALAFVSFLIFGGRACEELIKLGKSESARYYWNAFEGEGAIFEVLAKGLDPLKQTSPHFDELLWRGAFDSSEFCGDSSLPVVVRNLDEVSDKEPQTVRDDFAALKRRWYFEHPDGRLQTFSDADDLFRQLQDTSQAMAIRLRRLIGLINGWWNKADSDKGDNLRLWTRLSYSPRPRSNVMVSGHSVQRPKLNLFRPELSPVLRRAFGEQPVSHMVMASTDDPRFARLVIDKALIEALLNGSASEMQDQLVRRITQFNDALSQYAEKGSDVRAIQIVDPQSELQANVVVDLSNRKYDSAT